MKKLLFVIPLVFLGFLLYRRSHIKKSPFRFETDRITFVYYDDTEPNWRGELKEIEITDPDIIETMTAMFSQYSFTRPAPDNDMDTLCSMWLDFHTGTVIGLTDNLSCGTIGEEITENMAAIQMPVRFQAYFSQLIKNGRQMKLKKIS